MERHSRYDVLDGVSSLHYYAVNTISQSLPGDWRLGRVVCNWCYSHVPLTVNNVLTKG